MLRRTKGEAIQPLRQSIETLKEKQLAQGARTFDAQYQQKPQGAEGAIIKREWLSFYDEYSKPQEFETVLQSWDNRQRSTVPCQRHSKTNAEVKVVAVRYSSDSCRL